MRGVNDDGVFRLVVDEQVGVVVACARPYKSIQ